MAEAKASGAPPGALSLRAEAAPFAPPQRPGQEADRGLKPVRTFAPRREVLNALDAVPFTPSQGICTPSPAHVMLVQQPVMFAECSPGWAPMGAAGSPRASSSSGQSESSAGGYGCAAEPSPTSTSSNPGTPYGRPLLFSSFYFPMPFSPRALQRAAQQGAAGGEPHTPVRAHFGGSGGMPGDEAGGGGGMPPGFGLYGSPLAGVQSPGQLVFTQFFAPDALDPAMSGELPDSPPDGSELSGGLGAGGSGALLDGDLIELTPAARQIAAAMCAAQNLQGPPPSQLVELASLLQAYGLVNTLSPPPSATTSPEKQVRRTKSAPRTNPDGTVRLNARQRRTLRRAQERAIKALMDMQTQLLGIDGEQAAANMAAMVGMQPMVFGSPPHSAPAPPPVQLQPLNPVQALYPMSMPVMPPAPHMVAASWAGVPAVPSPVMSQPLAFMDHTMSMPIPVPSLAHGGPPVYTHTSLEFPPASGPMAAPGGLFGVPQPALRSAPGGYAGGGGGHMGRAASAPQPFRGQQQQQQQGAPRQLSRFAPGGGGAGAMSVEAH